MLVDGRIQIGNNDGSYPGGPKTYGSGSTTMLLGFQKYSFPSLSFKHMKSYPNATFLIKNFLSLRVDIVQLVFEGLKMTQDSQKCNNPVKFMQHMTIPPRPKAPSLPRDKIHNEIINFIFFLQKFVPRAARDRKSLLSFLQEANAMSNKKIDTSAFEPPAGRKGVNPPLFIRSHLHK